MPIYEFRCGTCDKVIKALRPISECADPITAPCIDDPQGGSVLRDCKFTRILSPTPTTFRFNDRLGYKGLDKRTDKK